MDTKVFQKELRNYATEERARVNAWFFKTGKGEYGEGDIFLGVTVPNVRKVVKQFMHELEVDNAVELLQSKYHEDRLAGCIIFVELMKRAIKDDAVKDQKKIYSTYVKNTTRINNWDLVDVSASSVVGYYISEKMDHEERLKIINRLINSNNLWENRIIIVATLYQIKKGNEKMLFYVAERLMGHKHDLIHKAIGWMLREVGKNCGIETLNIFLEKHSRAMPRTMLRYAIERHHQMERAKILAMSK
jgi:3-methyladenine DNA glycosylase AlkD